jgi:hypothetical protein
MCFASLALCVTVAGALLSNDNAAAVQEGASDQLTPVKASRVDHP